MSLNRLLDRFLQFERTHAYTAYLYAGFGNLALAMMQLCVKLLSKKISTAHILYLRSFFLIMLNSTVLILTGHEFYAKARGAFKLLVIRILLSAMGIYFYFSAVNCISLSVINALWMTSPVWTPFAEWLIIGVQSLGYFRPVSTSQPSLPY